MDARRNSRLRQQPALLHLPQRTSHERASRLPTVALRQTLSPAAESRRRRHMGRTTRRRSRNLAATTRDRLRPRLPARQIAVNTTTTHCAAFLETFLELSPYPAERD